MNSKLINFFVYTMSDVWSIHSLLGKQRIPPGTSILTLGVHSMLLAYKATSTGVYHRNKNCKELNRVTYIINKNY